MKIGFNKVHENIPREKTSNIKNFTGQTSKQFFELFDFMKIFS